MKDRLVQYAESIKNELVLLSEYILANPELGYEEFKACKAHMDMLKKHGFKVEEEYLGIKTAFRAVFDSGKEGPTIGFMSEYDALPGIGHGCGHNLLGTTNTGAGIVLSKLIKDLKGKVIVFGTPAEETSGAKVEMVEKGAFNDIDIVMEVHPGSLHFKSGTSLAMEAVQFKFTGKAAHAAAYPEKGINALDAAINTFVNINALRQHILSDSRIHGVITEGGRAANIVPDLAIAQFYVRATTKAYLTELVEKVKNCARGAALAAGAGLEISNYEASYDNLVTNQVLSEVYCKNLMEMGVKEINEPRKSYGSLDVGNVSQIVPTIHPYFGICEEDIAAHTADFAEATRTALAYESMIQTIGALVLTAIEILKDDGLLQRIRKEFSTARK
ncbi:MAG TPA: M20 family metallopeptidase [Clostridia bacterium]|nr:M20 family metallopeptidase [Clostridia bacterium]